MLILAVDDDLLMLRAIRRTLIGYDVVTVDCAREALLWIDGGQRFDLVLVDAAMPDMTGHAFYEELMRRDSELARAVVFLTGTTDASTEAFLQTISNDRLEKPFGVDVLQALVRRRLESSMWLN